jgi:hypothetical protein
MFIKNSPTTWHGIRFRSKLETKWAKVFDAMHGAPWLYEPRKVLLTNGRGYIPDFYFPMPWCLWVEIKGDGPTEDEMEKCHQLANITGERVFLIRGVPHLHVRGWRFGDGTVSRVESLAEVFGPGLDVAAALVKARRSR